MPVPILAAIFVVILYFFYGMRWGVTRLLSGGIAVGLALAVFFVGMNLGPPNLENRFGFEISWEFILVGSSILAVVVFFLTWVILTWFFRFLYNRDSILHPLAKGIPGGIQALLPAAILIFLLFNAFRAIGTLYELRYVAAITQPAIVDADFDRLPEPSAFTRWRNQLETLPRLADLLDRCDPFSRRENRNVGILSLFAAQEPARTFAKSSAQMGSLLRNPAVQELVDSPVMASQLRLGDRVGLVLSKRAMALAEEPRLIEDLSDLDLETHVVEYIRFLKTNKTLNYPEN